MCLPIYEYTYIYKTCHIFAEIISTFHLCMYLHTVSRQCQALTSIFQGSGSWNFVMYLQNNSMRMLRIRADYDMFNSFTSQEYTVLNFVNTQATFLFEFIMSAVVHCPHYQLRTTISNCSLRLQKIPSATRKIGLVRSAQHRGDRKLGNYFKEQRTC